MAVPTERALLCITTHYTSPNDGAVYTGEPLLNDVYTNGLQRLRWVPVRAGYAVKARVLREKATAADFDTHPKKKFFCQLHHLTFPAKIFRQLARKRGQKNYADPLIFC